MDLLHVSHLSSSYSMLEKGVFEREKVSKFCIACRGSYIQNALDCSKITLNLCRFQIAIALACYLSFGLLFGLHFHRDFLTS